VERDDHVWPTGSREDRYVGGLRMYVSECQPAERFAAVVDNNDLLEPSLAFMPAP
jgi:hypothetical protein